MWTRIRTNNTYGWSQEPDRDVSTLVQVVDGCRIVRCCDMRAPGVGSAEGVVIDDTDMFNDRLQQWEDFHNFHRPQGALGGQTPYERLRERTGTRV
jgi:transposase InsO family protein